MTIIWTVSLVCWSVAGLLVAGLTFPDIFRLGREERHTRQAC